MPVVRARRSVNARPGGWPGPEAGVGAGLEALFGPTDPQIWAPPRAGVEVLRDESGVLDAISVDRVFAVAEKALSV